MKAVFLRELGGPEVLRVEELPDPRAGAGEVVVRLRAAALNHRDVFIRMGRYAGIKLPVILGSDGSGDVVEIGPGVDQSWHGREVIIDPSFNWGSDERAQGPSFHLLGLPSDGTYAEKVKVPAEQLHSKPGQLSFEEAAAVPLASVTAYRALVTRARVQRGEAVVITGIGGGVATAALQIANHLGARVYVTSGSDEKLERARQLGAAGGANHRDTDWPRTLSAVIGGRPDVVVDGAGGDTFNNALDLLAPGGRLVSYGATTGAASQVEVRRIFWKQLNVIGTTMGTRADFAAMVQLYTDGLRPTLDQVLPLEAVADAHRRMEEGRQFGKIVLKIRE